jgi:serine-type D-Ala-D-Ala carboxypeptidase/endopeptidase (penicillin-binding protein 4)
LRLCNGYWCLVCFLSLWLQPAIAVAGTAQPSPNTQGICPAQLGETIEAITVRPPFHRTRWGILVQTLDTSETLYAQDAQHYFLPASNIKLLTTAAALTQLGSDFRVRTSVYRLESEDRSPESGLRSPELIATSRYSSASSFIPYPSSFTLSFSSLPPPSSLLVVGRGDPSFSDAQLRMLTGQIQRRGITKISQLRGDDHFFRGDAVNLSWEWEDLQSGYAAPVNSLILNQNAIALTLIPQPIGQPLQLVWSDPAEINHWQVENHSLTVASSEPEFVHIERDLSSLVLYVRGQLQVDSEPEEEAIAIPNPGEYFLRRFRQTLANQDIPVEQVLVAPNPAAEDAEEIAAVQSPPLAELLVEANQESNNLYAEAMLRWLGVMRSSNHAARASALAAGISAVEASLADLGVDPDGYVLADGSGISRHSLVSPEAFVQTLQVMAQVPEAEVYRNSLAIAGVSGTLRNRFVDTPIAGRLWGKTGTASGVAALSGYLNPSNYPSLVFSIIVNHFDQPVREVRPVIDEIVLLLGQLHNCQNVE